MANTIDTPAKPTDLDPNIKLGSVDDTKAVETILYRAMTQAAKVPADQYFWVDFGPDTLFCEDTVNWPGTKTVPCKNLAVMINQESRTLGYDDTGKLIPADQADALGNAKNMVVRNRAHQRADWARHCKLTRSTIKGPHTGTYRNRSINSVMEQQCGVWLLSTTDFEVCATTISEVWGDHISQHTAEPYGQLCQGNHIWANTFDRNGRECVLLTGAGACEVHDNTILRHTSQIFHSESGAGKMLTQGPWLLHNNLVSDVPGVQGGYFLHCTGGSTVTEIWIQSNVVQGQALQCYIGTGATTKIGECWILDNTWNLAPAGGYLLRADNMREVHYRRNKGRARTNQTMAQQYVITRCDLKDIDTTGIVQ